MKCCAVQKGNLESDFRSNVLSLYPQLFLTFSCNVVNQHNTWHGNCLGFIPSGATLLLCEPIRELSVALPVLFVGTEGQLMQWVFLQVILGCWFAAKGLGAQSAQLSISAAPGLLLALLCPLPVLMCLQGSKGWEPTARLCPGLDWI